MTLYMLDLFFLNPLIFLIVFPGLLLSITVHEFAHAWAADQLGDPTPRSQGRLTLNPRSHLDTLGTIAILLTRFGWGRSVEFDPYNLKEPLRDTALISLAGPVSNLLLAGVLALIINFNLIPVAWLTLGLAQVLIINVVLAVFNFVPVHPLDGSKIILAVLPPDTAAEYQHFMRRYGTLLLILLILPWNGVSPVSRLILPLIDFIVAVLI